MKGAFLTVALLFAVVLVTFFHVFMGYVPDRLPFEPVQLPTVVMP